jgi:putative tryptophan/tyrosine transport system substrate-binding protein
MKRRGIITLFGAAATWSGTVVAQTPVRPHRIAMISVGAPMGATTPNGKALLAGLAELGYTPGKNLGFEARGALGQKSKLPEIIAELKAGGVEVLVTAGYPSALAAKESGIPTVVAFGSGDPVATGLIASLARPGGNVTGVSDVATALSTKRLSLLKELLPKMRRVAMLWNKDDLGMSLRYEASAAAASSIGVTVQALGVREPNDFEGVFEAMDREPPDAILMVSDALTTLNRKRVFDYAAAKRLPAIFEYDSLPHEGGLMSYGPDLKESFARAAVLADRILKGAKPSELPFEQPTRYLFVINLKTAKAIGLDIPPTLLAFADEVIE